MEVIHKTHSTKSNIAAIHLITCLLWIVSPVKNLTLHQLMYNCIFVWCQIESRVAVHYRGVAVGAVDGLGGATLARVYNISMRTLMRFAV